MKQSSESSAAVFDTESAPVELSYQSGFGNEFATEVPKPNRMIKLSCAINLRASSVSRIAVFISFALCFEVDHH